MTTTNILKDSSLLVIPQKLIEIIGNCDLAKVRVTTRGPEPWGTAWTKSACAPPPWSDLTAHIQVKLCRELEEKTPPGSQSMIFSWASNKSPTYPASSFHVKSGKWQGQEEPRKCNLTEHIPHSKPNLQNQRVNQRDFWWSNKNWIYFPVWRRCWTNQHNKNDCKESI